MDRKKKIISSILCVLVAVLMGAVLIVGGAAEVENTEAKTEATVETVPDKKEEVKEETPKTEAPKTEAPKTDAPKTDAPKTEAPKTESTEAKTEDKEEDKPSDTSKDEEKSEDTEGTKETEVTEEKSEGEEKTEEEQAETEKKEEKQEKKEEPVKEEPKKEAAPAVKNKVEQKKEEAKAKEKEAEKKNPAVEEPAKDDKTDWDYAPGWVGGEGTYMRGNLLAAATARGLNISAKAYAEDIRESICADGEVRIEEDADNICEVLAVYAVLTGQTDGFPYGVSIDNEDYGKLMQSVYWNMNRVTGTSNADGDVIKVKRLGIEEAAEALGLTKEQAEAAQALLTDDARADIEIILTGSILTRLTDEELKSIEERLPKELSSERKAVLMAGLSLEGKIGYFWGGKSFCTGWDERWGEMRTVVGSKQDGKVKPLGLDCSGFVSWAFINATGDRDVLSYVGNGTANQYKNSKEIGWNEVQPGDLLFYKNPSAGGVNHVGIVLTVNEDGTPREVIHCASSKNGVVVTGPKGFKYARRPYAYGE